ncbi:alpha/beta fold hydrolase [Streptosporangium algeriense]|uniref:Alpha/beta fold hydrolase n=1 Tax=Streptosporangium algeriense TaxID=1682748 RepID=A0ABW3DHA9_9ACTN
MATNPFEDDNADSQVFVNGKGRHSLWPASADFPSGWIVIDGRACLECVDANWTDTRPKNLVAEMNAWRRLDRAVGGAYSPGRESGNVAWSGNRKRVIHSASPCGARSQACQENREREGPSASENDPVSPSHAVVAWPSRKEIDGRPGMAGNSAFGESEYALTRDGRRLHYVTSGNGDPLVIFEAGGNGSRTTWGLVQGRLAAITGTLAYDRAGFGRSDPDNEPRTLDRIVDDLEDLVEFVGAGRCVLVGHSLGGPICRSFTYRRPELVAGLVLVDQSCEDCDFYYGRAFNRLGALSNKLFTVPLARLGILGFLTTRRLYKDFPADMVREIRAEEFSSSAFRAHESEVRNLAESFRALRLVSEARSLPDIPVTVISGSTGRNHSRGVWAQLAASHQRLAKSLPQGKHVWAEGSGHLVPVDAPELVIEETADVLKSI